MNRAILPFLLLLPACQGAAPTGEAASALHDWYLSRDYIDTVDSTKLWDIWQAIDDTHVYVLDDSGTLWFEDGVTKTYVSNGVIRFRSGGEPWLWVEDGSGALWHWDRTQPITSAKFIAYTNDNFEAGSYGVYWREGGNINAPFQLYYSDGNSPGKLVDYRVFQYFPVDADNIYVQGMDGNLWLEHPVEGLSARQYQDANPVRVEGAGQVAYVKGWDFKLWREAPGQGHGPNPVDQNVLAFHALDPSFVFVEGEDNRLWREDGDSTHRDLVDADVRDFQPTSLVTVWVEGSDGKLWREHLSWDLP